MTTPRYMKLKTALLPQDTISFYNLQDKITRDWYVYVKICNGMYGLKGAAILAYDQLAHFMKNMDIIMFLELLDYGVI